MDKTKLPRDIKERCRWLVIGYDRCRREYAEQRKAIMDGGGGNYQTYKVKTGTDKNGKPIFEERRTYTGGSHIASRTTEDRELKLESLEKQRWVMEMHALERARDRIGAGMPEEMREALRKAIFLNCINGKEHPFERLYTIGISRRGFYRYKEAFFWDVANELGII
jgi:hypothetical protein